MFKIIYRFNLRVVNYLYNYTLIIDINRLFITERDLCYSSDNLISYYVGPIFIDVNPINKTIIVTNLSTLDLDVNIILPFMVEA
jgi:hypothetical protein